MRRLAAGLVSLALAGTAACGSTEPTEPAPEPRAALEPPCDRPAPLLGVPDPRAPEYIVVFHSTVDAEQEAARLAAAYGFQPRYVWAAALEGFSAELTPGTVAEIRCEPAVDYVEHDQVFPLD